MQFEAQVRASPEEISAATECAGEFLRLSDVDERAAHHVAMILEELLTNLGTHGRVIDDPATVRLSVAPDAVNVEVVDSGPPFDPRLAPDPDVDTSLEERRFGGLGLFLMRKLANDLYYASSGGQNCTRFSVQRAARAT
jgi:serine/threonine-protein kinase RsbW